MSFYLFDILLNVVQIFNQRLKILDNDRLFSPLLRLGRLLDRIGGRQSFVQQLGPNPPPVFL